ncbi:MAG: alcohol dehydrogenase catalytic domain-containing protein [Chloroflexi bacterium]|nr:alcohol dehydrogenase catalytic domain-containing protein [Chloroflexota bacterium]
MQAALITGPRKVETKDLPQPAPGGGEVLVRVRGCGICGSDLHFYRGDFPAMPNVPPGHELAGEVAELGEGVEGWSPGQRVVIEPLWVCRECSYCRTGSYQLCPRRRFVGTFAPGGMAEYISVPAYSLYRLPEDLDFELGALVEPLSVVVHGLHVAGLTVGERVLVLGSGSIGLLAAFAARAAGAGEVVATYRHEHQGKAALAAGAHRAVKADDEGIAGLKAEAQSSPADVVLETVGGHADTLQQAVDLVRLGGRVVVLGLFTGPVPVNALTLMLKEARVMGGITYCRPGPQSDFDVSLRLLAAEPERARSMISHRFPLAQAADAFATALDKSTGSLKVHVHP